MPAPLPPSRGGPKGRPPPGPPPAINHPPFSIRPGPDRREAGFGFYLLLGFLIIVFWSPDGILGLWEKVRAARERDPLLDRGEDRL